MQASQVAGEVVQQVPEHLVAEPQSATSSLCPQIERLFGVREGLELVNQTPGEPAAEIFAQWQLRWRGSTGRKHRGLSIACGIDRDEQRSLCDGIECLDVVGDKKLRIGVRRGSQQVGASAARFAP